MDEQHERGIQAAEEAEMKAAAPPIPYRANTTGFSTSHLPKPPTRRLGHDNQPSALPANPSIKPKPTLPPRLPPRQSPAPTQDMVASLPAYSGFTQDQSQKSYINRGALSRLGSAGVSVPGFGIGTPGIGGGSQEASPWRDQKGLNAGGVDPNSPDGQAPQLSELQSKFSKMSTTSQSASSPAQGTSFAQKQAALTTASSFRNDPSSISLSDAKATASTANNFRERHGEQVAAGWNNAGALNKKYDVANKVNGLAANGRTSPTGETFPGPADTDTPGPPSPLSKKKAPPPPPKKRLVESSSATLPPPIPLYSKPR